MKLVIIIPAFNEEKSIGTVIRKIPRRIPYVDNLQILVVDDGSTDNTVKTAIDAGCNFVVSHNTNLGLARAIKTGFQSALALDADAAVVIDADNQFDPSQIPQLVGPICTGLADLVIGSRQIFGDDHTTLSKKIGNIVATKVTSIFAGIKIRDAQSGFRALSKKALLNINIRSKYTYTQEMILQCAYKGLKIVQISVNVRKREEGKSRLVSSIFTYARRAGMTIFRTALPYIGTKIFGSISATALIAATCIAFLFSIQEPYVIAGVFTSGAISSMSAALAIYAIRVRRFVSQDDKRLYEEKVEKRLDFPFCYSNPPVINTVVEIPSPVTKESDEITSVISSKN